MERKTDDNEACHISRLGSILTEEKQRTDVRIYQKMRIFNTCVRKDFSILLNIVLNYFHGPDSKPLSLLTLVNDEYRRFGNFGGGGKGSASPTTRLSMASNDHRCSFSM